MKIADNLSLATEEGLAFLLQILPRLGKRHTAQLAARSLYSVLAQDIGKSREPLVQRLLEIAGSNIDESEAIRIGLSTGVPSNIASQNLVLFESASDGIRTKFAKASEAIVQGIIGRRILDLSYEGANAAGRLLWDASSENYPGFVRAAAMLLPFAMRERCQPASALIAAVFPSVYRGLQHERTPDFLSLMFPLLVWDRRKIACRELATGLSGSKWFATDIALAAARSGDTARILRVVASSPNGRSAISAIERDIDLIQLPWRQTVRNTLSEIYKSTGD